jgi:hypothetical protein
MFKLLSAITIAAVIMISTPAKSAIFTMPISLVCDDAKDISNWKLVTKKTRNYYFCKDECWEEWLNEY